jgi:hypothetical protein
MSEEYEESGYIECDDMPIYAQVPMWITLANIPPQSKIAWIFLSEHANVARQMGKKRVVAPKMDTIAKAIGTSRQRLRKFLKELVDIGALEQHQYRYAGGMRRGYTYKIRSAVPAEYSGPTSLGEYYNGVGGYQFEWMEHRTEGAEKAISAGQAGGVPMTPTGGYLKDPTEGSPSVPVEGDQKSPAIRSDRRSKPFVGGSSVLPPPPPSSVGAGEDATPEAPLEEDEEIENFETNNDGFAIDTSQEGLEGASEGPDGIPEWLATLPGLNGPQAPAHGFLEYPVMLAVRAGWTLQALKKHLAPLVDPSKARSKNAIPGWYDRHLGELPEPPKAVVPLCDNPAHQLSPQEDPVNGGCLLCNTQAATGPREKTAIPPGILQDTGGDTVALGVAFRADRRAKRLARVAEPSRSDTPQVRAHREAERNRVKANDLLRTER